jgi:hypothetical protein
MRSVVAILIPLFFLFLTGGLFSCKDKSGADTPFERVQGKWKKIKYATDDNGNQQIDPFEIRELEGGVNNELVFNKDSTGYETSNFAPLLNFTWNIVGDSIYRHGTGHLSITYHMEAVNSYNLTLTTNTNLGLAWYMYQKE